MKTRRTRLKLIYTGTDISRDVAPDLISFEYTDNESGKADDITVTLKDNKGLWSGAWHPTKGDEISATIIDEDFGELYCGRFFVDQLNFNGPPKVFQIKGASVPLLPTIRREMKSKAWEDVLLSQIVSEIATIGGLAPIFDSPKDPRYDRIDQRDESDLTFLKRICEAEGLSVKVTDLQLAVFDQAEYENRPPSGTIVYGISNLISFTFENQAYDRYSKCTVSYFDPATEEVFEKTFTDPEIADGMCSKLVKRASSYAEAERWAKADLRKRNKGEIQADFTLMGDTTIVAGITLSISGFGAYDGDYFVETATHSVSNGYTTKIKMRRKIRSGY